MSFSDEDGGYSFEERDENYDKFFLIEDSSDLPDRSITCKPQLKHAISLYREHRLPVIDTLVRGSRYTGFEIDDSIVARGFLNCSQNELIINLPCMDLDELLPIQFFKPQVYINQNSNINQNGNIKGNTATKDNNAKDNNTVDAVNNNTVDAEFQFPVNLDIEKLTEDYCQRNPPSMHPYLKKQLKQPIQTLHDFFLFCCNLKHTSYDFVSLQNKNPNCYLNIEGSTNMIRHKLMKNNPVDLLNEKQKEIFEAVKVFFHTPKDDVSNDPDLNDDSNDLPTDEDDKYDTDEDDTDDTDEYVSSNNTRKRARPRSPNWTHKKMPKIELKPESLPFPETGFKCYMIKGSAGTGKTFLMDALISSNLCEMLYVTTKGSLVEEVSALYDTTGSTLCSFICKLFGMSFHEYLSFICVVERLSETHIDEFVLKFGIEYQNIASILGDSRRLCIFFDEIGMVPVSVIRFLKRIVERYVENTTRKYLKILFLLAGDEKQIQPIKSVYQDNTQHIENICDGVFTLVESKRMTDPNFVNMLADIYNKKLEDVIKQYLPDNNNVTSVVYKYPVECFREYPEDLTPLKYRHLKDIQKGITFHISKKCIDSIDPRPDQWDFGTLNSGKILVETKSTSKLLYQEHIPPEFSHEAMKKMCLTDIFVKPPPSSCFYANFIPNLPKLINWWISNKAKFNQTIILSKTNAAVHNLNLQVYLKCHSDLRTFNTLNGNEITKSKFLRFSKIYKKTLNWKFPLPPSSSSSAHHMYVLPLVVGMQYIMLTSVGKIRLGANVYLLGFLDYPNDPTHCPEAFQSTSKLRKTLKIRQNDQCGLIMATENNQLFILYPTEFEMRLFKDFELYGFPLQMGAACNIFNSQGKTLHHRNIYLDLQLCTINEIFVALSRPRYLSQIKSVLH